MELTAITENMGYMKPHLQSEYKDLLQKNHERLDKYQAQLSEHYYQNEQHFKSAFQSDINMV